MFEEKGCFKVNEHGELVDMRKLPYDRLQKLLAYYEGKLRGARSRDMRLAYEQCVKQIRSFMTDNRIEDRMDVFSIAYQMGLKDVRSMIKTYFGKLETEEETAKGIIKQHFEKRRQIYSGSDLPSDKIVREIFNLLKIEKLKNLRLSNIQKVANVYSGAYAISSPQVKLEPRSEGETKLFYNFDTRIIHIYLDHIPGSIALMEFLIKGLFEHLCESRSWKFHEDPVRSFELQRQETGRYTERFFDRCAAMGLLGRRTD